MPVILVKATEQYCLVGVIIQYKVYCFTVCSKILELLNVCTTSLRVNSQVKDIEKFFHACGAVSSAA